MAKTARAKVGLAVDSGITQQDILMKFSSETLSKTKGVSGVTILGDCQVALVLDDTQFINRTND